MSDLEKIRGWLQTFPETNQLKTLCIDYTDPAPSSGGLCPRGLQEISRKWDVIGSLTVENRYSFGLYYVFQKAPGDDAGAARNAQFLLDLQIWAQEQYAQGLAPVFGDDPARERVRVENGKLYTSDQEGVATYQAELTVDFVKHYCRGQSLLF